MRQLFPVEGPDDVDIATAYLPGPLADGPVDGIISNRPWVTINMVASVDGAVSVEGKSGPMSVPGDREIFRTLRSMADVVLVGAGTVRTERYGPVRLTDDLLASRTDRGQVGLPRLAVVTASGNLDPGLPLFDPSLRGGSPMPLVVTGSQGRARASALDGRAEFLIAGDADVDLAFALSTLADGGARVVLGEGGPVLNAALLAEDLIDEMCLTVAPLVASGAAARIIGNVGVAERPTPMELAHLLEHGGALFSRWRFSAPSAGRPSPTG
jgi:riboflavin biosynthesis pyrimidine reductase